MREIDRIIVIFLIPFIITLVLSHKEFVTTELPSKQRVITISNRQEAYQSFTNNSNTMLNSIGRSILENLLDVDIERLGLLYEACFVNNDTKIIYANGEEDTGVNVTLLFNNQTEFTIPHNQERCNIYSTNENFTYTWYFNFSFNATKIFELPPEIIQNTPIAIWSTTFRPSVYSYPRIQPLSFLKLYLAIFLAFWGFLWPTILRINKLVKSGFWKL